MNSDGNSVRSSVTHSNVCVNFWQSDKISVALFHAKKLEERNMADLLKCEDYKA